MERTLLYYYSSPLYMVVLRALLLVCILTFKGRRLKHTKGYACAAERNEAPSVRENRLNSPETSLPGGQTPNEENSGRKPVVPDVAKGRSSFFVSIYPLVSFYLLPSYDFYPSYSKAPGRNFIPFLFLDRSIDSKPLSRLGYFNNAWG